MNGILFHFRRSMLGTTPKLRASAYINLTTTRFYTFYDKNWINFEIGVSQHTRSINSLPNKVNTTGLKNYISNMQG